MAETTTTNPIKKRELTLTLADCNVGPEINLTKLLQVTGRVRIIYGSRTYLLKKTPKGGIQLCAEADS